LGLLPKRRDDEAHESDVKFTALLADMRLCPGDPQRTGLGERLDQT
jgi:hypothetical protein